MRVFILTLLLCSSGVWAKSTIQELRDLLKRYVREAEKTPKLPVTFGESESDVGTNYYSQKKRRSSFSSWSTATEQKLSAVHQEVQGRLTTATEVNEGLQRLLHRNKRHSAHVDNLYEEAVADPYFDYEAGNDYDEFLWDDAPETAVGGNWLTANDIEGIFTDDELDELANSLVPQTEEENEDYEEAVGEEDDMIEEELQEYAVGALQDLYDDYDDAMAELDKIFAVDDETQVGEGKTDNTEGNEAGEVPVANAASDLNKELQDWNDELDQKMDEFKKMDEDAMARLKSFSEKDDSSPEAGLGQDDDNQEVQEDEEAEGQNLMGEPVNEEGEVVDEEIGVGQDEDDMEDEADDDDDDDDTEVGQNEAEEDDDIDDNDLDVDEEIELGGDLKLVDVFTDKLKKLEQTLTSTMTKDFDDYQKKVKKDFKDDIMKKLTNKMGQKFDKYEDEMTKKLETKEKKHKSQIEKLEKKIKDVE